MTGCDNGKMVPGKVGEQMGSFLSPEYWCNAQFMAKFMNLN